MDFGEFPPAPLQCSELKGAWNHVSVRGIGHIFQNLKLFRALARAVVQDEGVIDRKIASDQDFQEARRSLRSLKEFPRLVAAALWIGPILIAVRPRYFRGPFGRARDGVAGYFHAACADDIVFMATERRVMSDAAVASHEHIHLLQHRDGEDRGRFLRSPSSLLSDDALAIPQLHYFFEKEEVEARLHECVLSFYRARGCLPLTVPGFLSLLGTSQRFGWLVASILQVEAGSLDYSDEPYPEREVEFAKQLEMILLAIRTPELERRFITEVLTVMYGNLLRYYGDKAASRQFLAQIDRPNLYDEIYSAEPS